MIDGNLLAGLFAPPETRGQLYGVVVGVVTNNQDPEKQGRVKVKFPWLSDENESQWARVLTPMAGNGYGLYTLPQTGDAVLVAFEHGMVEFPYVLGALWNGQDKPPEGNDDGKNNRRLIKSRSGHIIRLDDTDGSEKIEIVDKKGKNSIVIDTAKDTITIGAGQQITIVAEQDLAITSNGGKLMLKGKTGIELASEAGVKVTAKANMDLEASGPMKIKGATVDIN